MADANEPSVADILASIKRVLAEDGDAARRPSATPARHEPAARRADEPDVLELTVATAQPSAAVHEPASDPLVDAGKAESMRASLAALATMAEPGAAPQIVRSGETSLEQLARDLLRPMLKDWLDSHLPPLVESLVRAEIERIARKG